MKHMKFMYALVDLILEICYNFLKQAAWPSGKAADCKSAIPSSNLGAA